MAERGSSPAWRDIRGVGFTARSTLADAWAWLDGVPNVAMRETLPSSRAVGRVLAGDICAPRDLPPARHAAIDGFAVHAADSAGAGIYSPVPLTLSDLAGAGRALPVIAGAALPPEADAVLSFAAVSRAGPDRLHIITEAAPGEGVSAGGRALRGGTVALAAGHVLRPQDVALLAMLGVANVQVVSRPRVRLAIAGPKEGQVEALEAMLRALVERDGGQPCGGVAVSFGAAIAEPTEAAIILIAGRSGPGEDDVAAPAVVQAGGEVVMHGIAMRPGASSGVARLHEKTAVLLPGAPLACLTAYDMLAGRLIRRVAGLSCDLPYCRAALRLGRKIVSAIGVIDVVPVALVEGAVVPTASTESGELPAACRAAGFVLVPESLEGYAEGESVSVCLYDIFGRNLYS